MQYFRMVMVSKREAECPCTESSNALMAVSRSSTSILQFGTKHAIKFLLRNTPRALLVRQVVRHVVIESVWIRNNDINQPLQIVKEAGENIPAPRIIGGTISTSRAVRDDEPGTFPIHNTKRRESPYRGEST